MHEIGSESGVAVPLVGKPLGGVCVERAAELSLAAPRDHRFGKQISEQRLHRGASVAPSTTPPGGGAATPTDAFKMYYSASKSKDVETIKVLFPKATLKNLEDQAKATNKSLDDILRQGLEAASEHVPETMPETRNEKIEGDRATLEIKDDQQDKWDTIKFIKEDGQWKLLFSEPEPTGD